MPFLRPDLSAAADYSYPLCLRWFHALSHVGIPTMMHSIRQDIDKKSANEFLWTPYSDSDINECLPNFEPETVSAWTAVVPLIWYAVVEWHPVDRVQRQFGRLQTIPLDPPDFDDLHKITRQGKLEVDWSVKHVQWIAQWQDRHRRQALNEYRMFDEPMMSSGYFAWFFGSGKPYLLTSKEQAAVFEHVQRNRPRTHRTSGAGGSQRRRGAGASSSRATDPIRPQGPTQLMIQPRPPSPTEGFFTPIVGMMGGSSMLTTYGLFPGMIDGSSSTTVPSAFASYPSSGSGFVQHTPPQSLFFSSGPVGPSGTVGDDSNNERDHGPQQVPVQRGRRNPDRIRRPPDCGTGGHRQ
ncbi:hypothetical protein HRI_002770700 [Hibiscus trionum]|uniref:Aminotransferase-like plant mobile domain-containing protein n=1 Tax=Hibiscus trionum TaxID=183268 RepID=A0A9W7I7V3_HIBTR|nr:hypothetical protein HRI_002770700 [Hibiscus trionum]